MSSAIDHHKTESISPACSGKGKWVSLRSSSSLLCSFLWELLPVKGSLVRSKRPFFNSTILLVALAFCAFLTGCGAPAGDSQLAANTRVQLMDWHISGFWVINSPVAWIRVYNYNDVPIKEVTIQYNTFDEANNPLDQGTYTIDETILPSQYRQY